MVKLKQFLKEQVRDQYLRVAARRDSTRLNASLRQRFGTKPEQKHGLFIDCGSNLGQGFAFFQPYFPPVLYDYCMIEPNPHCAAHLRSHLLATTDLNITLIEAAASDRDGSTHFFGLVEDDRGEHSSGGSIIQNHNSAMYEADESRSIEVKTIDFARFLVLQSERYAVIALKMDIEGAEYGVIRHLLAVDAVRHIDLCFIEFHSAYMTGTRKQEHEILEKEYRRILPQHITHFREWY